VGLSFASMSDAWADWWKGTRHAELWWTLAWFDIVLRYRRSMLGPLWLTLSMGILLLGMGPLYSTLFHVPLRGFFPHLTLGIIFWTFFTSAINDACGVFVGAAPYLKQQAFPPSIFVWRSIARNFIQLGHHLILYVPVAIWAGVHVSSNTIMFAPGLALVLVNLCAASISLGIICARYRDVSQIVGSSLQLLMFLTPVFWFPESLPDRAHFILYNPFAQLLDIVRLPLMNATIASGTWWFLAYFTALNAGIAFTLYAAKRRELVYWI
jgi:lipopolysaccharide transport system permease protein